MLLSAQDVVEAFQEGRVWESFANKVSGTASATNGAAGDWCLSTGLPVFDARISGDPLAFFPVVSGGKEQLYHGPACPPYKRYLHSVEAHGFISLSAPSSFMVYDLVGYYPFIDGDGGLQSLDSSVPLPRYADGAGLRMAVMNSVIPPTGGSDNVVITFDNQDGDTVSTPAFGMRNVPNSFVNQAFNVSASAGSMASVVNMPSGSNGVRRINSINIPGSIGGAFALCIIKPLGVFKGVMQGSNQNRLAQQWVKSAFQFPEVPDGAALNVMYFNGTATQAGAPSVGTYKFTFFHA